LYYEFTSPEPAETLAIQTALALTREKGYRGIMLAWDCLSVVDRINNYTLDCSFLGVVIEDVKMEIANFVSYVFFHVPRKRNE
jgi:hypothetical protein